MLQARFFNLMLISSISLFLLPSCKHDPLVPPDTGGPVSPIDTGITSGWPCSPDTVYFQNQVLPLLISKCTQSGCHDVASHEDGVVLVDYQRVISTGKVKPFKPQDSELYEVIIDSDPDDRMPQAPNPPLTAAEKDLIKTWIEQGAKNTACNENFGSCDTTNITYTNGIAPLLSSRCTGCHSGANPQGNLKLTTYAEVKASVQSGALYGAVAHLPGYSAMPKGGTPLSPCFVSKIKSWIDAGMPQ